MSEFSHNGINYRIGTLNTIKQWHLNRRVAPLIPALVPVFMKVTKDGNALKDVEGVAALLGPFADGIAGMSDEASEYIINECLSVISREVAPGSWSKVWSVQGAISPFPEFNDLGTALPIIAKVVWEVLGPFIRGLVSSPQTEAKPSPPSS